MTKEQRHKDAKILTNKAELRYLENIQREYQEAYDTIRRELSEWAARYMGESGLNLADAQRYNRLDGLMKRLDGLLEKVKATDYAKHAEYAAGVYELNYMYEGYILETAYQVRLAYGKLNIEAVKESILNPLDKIAALEGKERLKNSVRRAITQGIVKGESVSRVAKTVMEGMNKNLASAERIVRTETVRATNAGNLDSMTFAANRGLPIKKKWLATLDSRTRDSHQGMDGEVRDVDKPFSNGLMFPGDPAGAASEVINCRCRMVEYIEDFDLPTASRVAKENGRYEVIENMTYEQWKASRTR